LLLTFRILFPSLFVVDTLVNDALCCTQHACPPNQGSVVVEARRCRRASISSCYRIPHLDGRTNGARGVTSFACLRASAGSRHRQQPYQQWSVVGDEVTWLSRMHAISPTMPISIVTSSTKSPCKTIWTRRVPLPAKHAPLVSTTYARYTPYTPRCYRLPALSTDPTPM
jgi:hypothetical protein